MSKFTQEFIDEQRKLYAQAATEIAQIAGRDEERLVGKIGYSDSDDEYQYFTYAKFENQKDAAYAHAAIVNYVSALNEIGMLQQQVKQTEAIQAIVAKAVEKRGYRLGWTKEQFAARQIAKLAEELGEVIEKISGLDVGLYLAINRAGQVGKNIFDDPERWHDITVHEGILEEIADMQVVIFNLAQVISEMSGQEFDVAKAAYKKAVSDTARGVRNA